jgi:hypothetical protein
MVTITADEALSRRLAELTEPAELRDAEGRLLAYITPPELRELYRQAREHFDPAETERRKQSAEPGITTKERLEHLHSLEAVEPG